MSSPDITICHRNLCIAAHKHKNMVEPTKDPMTVWAAVKGKQKTWVHSLPSSQSGKAKTGLPNCPTDRGGFWAGNPWKTVEKILCPEPLCVRALLKEKHRKYYLIIGAWFGQEWDGRKLLIFVIFFWQVWQSVELNFHSHSNIVSCNRLQFCKV